MIEKFDSVDIIKNINLDLNFPNFPKHVKNIYIFLTYSIVSPQYFGNVHILREVKKVLFIRIYLNSILNK